MAPLRACPAAATRRHEGGQPASALPAQPPAAIPGRLQVLVLATTSLLLPLPLKQHCAAQGVALGVSLLRIPRLARLHAAVPGHGLQCRAFVGGARFALQAFVPGAPVDLPGHPQHLATCCWMQHTWLAVCAGFLLPSGVALVAHWRGKLQAAGQMAAELALLMAAAQAAELEQRKARRERRQAAAGSAEPYSSDDSMSVSVAASDSRPELPELPSGGSSSPAPTVTVSSNPPSVRSSASGGSGRSVRSTARCSGRGTRGRSGSGRSSGAVSPHRAQRRSEFIRALRQHPEWLLQPARVQWLLLALPLSAAVWAALELAAQEQ